MTYPNPKQSTTRRLPEQLVIEYLGGGFSPRTTKRYRAGLRSWTLWCSRRKLDPLAATRLDIEAWTESLRHLLASSSLRSDVTAVCGCYRFAFETGWMPYDASAGVRRPAKETSGTGTWITREESQRMMDLAESDPDPRVAAIMETYFLLGVRMSEGLDADAADLRIWDEERETLTITRKTVGGIKEKQQLAIPARLSDSLHRMLGTRRSGPLFLSYTGKRLDADAANRIIDRLATKAGVDRRITAHSLRRSFATLSRDAEIPDRDIMASGGWHSTGMLDHYDMKRRSIERHAGITLSDWIRDAETVA
jgi:site-specific recombinase XerD